MSAGTISNYLGSAGPGSNPQSHQVSGLGPESSSGMVSAGVAAAAASLGSAAAAAANAAALSALGRRSASPPLQSTPAAWVGIMREDSDQLPEPPGSSSNRPNSSLMQSSGQGQDRPASTMMVSPSLPSAARVRLHGREVVQVVQDACLLLLTAHAGWVCPARRIQHNPDHLVLACALPHTYTPLHHACPPTCR